jgi:hypothetical protein
MIILRLIMKYTIIDEMKYGDVETELSKCVYSLAEKRD